MSMLRPPNLGELTQGQIDAFTDAFNLLDEDGSGTITTAELGTLMRSLGQNPTENELRALLKSVDADGDGTVDIPKFLAIMNRRMTVSDQESEIRDLFSLFDNTGQGYIEAEALRVVAKDLGHLLSMEDVNLMIAEGDKHRDGKIRYEEFARVLTTK